jgi:hypothetical protein
VNIRIAFVALHFMHYNFCRIHQSLRVTPAMQAGLSDHVWPLEELVRMADEYAASWQAVVTEVAAEAK